MKQGKAWFLIGAVSLALAGCESNGLSSSQTDFSQFSQQSLSVSGQPMLLDSGKGPELGFAAELGLTESQKIQIKSAVDALRERMKPPRPSGKTPPTFSEIKSKQEAMRDSLWNTVFNLLDSSQQSQALWIRSQIESGQRPSCQALDHARHLTADLSLDSAQSAKVLAIISQAQVLIPKALDAAVSCADVQSKMESIHADLDAEILAVLNESQAAIFKTLKPGNGKPDASSNDHRPGPPPPPLGCPAPGRPN